MERVKKMLFKEFTIHWKEIVLTGKRGKQVGRPYSLCASCPRDLLKGLNRRTSIASSRDRVTDIAVKAAKRGKVVKGLLEQGHHLIARVKSNAVAYLPVEPTKGKRKRGRAQALRQKDKAQIAVFG